MSKSYLKAFLLALLLGPLGLFYTNPAPAIGMLVIAFLAASAEVVLYLWILSIPANLFLVSLHNREIPQKRKYHVYHYPSNNPAMTITETVPENVRPFPGIENIFLSFRDLKEVIEKPEVHSEWHKKLSSVAGIYAILHKESGKLYVGSAYGEDGIIGRWEDYIPDGHGGNRGLQQLLKQNPKAKDDLYFSVLCTLPTYMSASAVIAEESLWKDKLGTRISGLNLN